MKCATCMWFVRKIAETIDLESARAMLDGKPLPQSPPTLGRCRRHAPTLSGYPAVFSIDWCGDHKLDENRV